MSGNSPEGDAHVMSCVQKSLCVQSKYGSDEGRASPARRDLTLQNVASQSNAGYKIFHMNDIFGRF
jgi:hypothetical protein